MSASAAPQPRPSTPRVHDFEVSLTRDGALGVLRVDGRPDLAGGAPPEFGGAADVWSPEHLLLGAVNLCLLTTFHALAAREPFRDLRYRDRIEGRVEKTSTGLRFTSIRHHVELGVAPDDRERALQVLERARKHCLIANSLAVPVELEVTMV